ncbi:MAG: hypothetical protein K2L30_04000, partial [Duncaniella sp.]|nr:hypothetical protein [Duncaniella sp.]
NATDLTIVVPATLPAGDTTVAFELSTGETVSGPNVELTAPECAYATVLPGDDVEIRAGETAVFTVANEDKLTAVKVNGQEVQYILNGTTLIVQIPAAAGANSTVTLVSSNGEISYNLAVIPMTHVGMTIWEGMWDCGEWGGNQDLAWGAYDWSQVPEGAKMTLYMTPTVADGEWWCVSLRHGDSWGALAGVPGQYDTPENGILEVTLTREILDDLIANNGLVVTGYKFVLNKITIEWEISLETIILQNDWECAGWGGNQDLAWGGYDWTTVKAGQILRFYMTPTVADGEWWCISLRHGDGWGNIPGLPGQYETPENGLIEVVLTQEVIDDLVANNGLVITGDGFILNKVTIE